MSLIDWRPAYAVGNAQVDHEHRELIALINTVHAGIRVQASPDEVATGLGEIYAQIALHFALEEKIMRDSHYPDLGSHKADHELLLDELSEIIDGVESDAGYNEQELSVILERWFSEHFRTHDAALHRKL
jgi:hemerythrin